KVLKMCTSVYFTGCGPTADIPEASCRIGFYSLYRLVVTTCGQSLLQMVRPKSGLDINAFWRHSVIVGTAAEMLAADHGQDAAEMFTAGLLHDFGKIILASRFKDQYGQLVSQANAHSTILVTREREA